MKRTLANTFVIGSAMALLLITGVQAQPAAEADQQTLEELREQLAQTQETLKSMQQRLDDLDGTRGQIADSRRSFPLSTQQDLMPRGQNGRNGLFFSGGKRPLIGLVLESRVRDRKVRLGGVTPDSPAEKAGLRPGDVLLSINGEDLSGRNGLKKAYSILDDLAEGDVFRFVYERDGEQASVDVEAALVQPALSFSYNSNGASIFGDQDYEFHLDPDNFRVDLGQMKEWAEKRRDWAIELNDGRWRRFGGQRGSTMNLGSDGPVVWNLAMGWSSLQLAELNSDLATYFGVERGVLVIDSQLADADLRGGDVITRVEGKAVASPGEAMRILTDFKPGQPVKLQLTRHGEEMDLTVSTPDAGPGDFSFGYWFGSSDDNDHQRRP